jgi:hypothetical protein
VSALRAGEHARKRRGGGANVAAVGTDDSGKHDDTYRHRWRDYKHECQRRQFFRATRAANAKALAMNGQPDTTAAAASAPAGVQQNGHDGVLAIPVFGPDDHRPAAQTTEAPRELIACASRRRCARRHPLPNHPRNRARNRPRKSTTPPATLSRPSNHGYRIPPQTTRSSRACCTLPWLRQRRTKIELCRPPDGLRLCRQLSRLLINLLRLSRYEITAW